MHVCVFMKYFMSYQCIKNLETKKKEFEKFIKNIEKP